MPKPGILNPALNGLHLLGLLLAANFLICARAAPGATSDLRQSLNFNREWKFLLGDHPGADAVAFDDSKWDAVGLPHSFSTPYFAAGNKFYVGYGWYRKAFDVPPGWKGKLVFLEFEAAFQDAEIFVNGQPVGKHQGGYTGFSINITSALKLDRNVVAVRLNNKWNAQLAPRAGEHVFSGGLYRDVHLTVTDPLHVAWYGTFVTTPKVSKTSAVVNVKTEVVNGSPVAKSATVKTDVLDTDGKIVTTMQSTLPVPAGKTVTFDQTSLAMGNPELWSPDHPYLYNVRTTVLNQGEPVDYFTSPLGFRWFEFTADKGLFLNAEHVYLKGANVHQDHAGWGDAVTNTGFARDIQLIKDAGFNFIRGSHYPHDPAFSDACDRLGMPFWSENCFWGTGGFQGDGYWNCSAYPVNPADEKPFEESVKASLRDMIRIHRNHPSILVWSMSNEPFFSDPKVLPKIRKFLSELVAYSHELDPTRPAAIGGSQRGDIDKLGDIAGYNGDGARLPEYMNPGVASVVSEYGSTTADRPGNYAPGWGDLPGAPDQNKSQPYSWRFPWRSGEIIWCGFDHGSIAGQSFGAMGLVDYFRLPKRSWYWYRNAYRNIPPLAWPATGKPAGLKLTADRTTIDCADGTDDTQVVVTVVDQSGKALSNSVPVTLTVESGPGEFPTGPSITFDPKSDIAIRDGQAAIELRAYSAGESVIRATSSGLADATIKIVSRNGPAFVAGRTPQAAVRPYVPFAAAPDTGAEDITTFGRENPTRASSEAFGHSARLANDGNPATFWQAANAGLKSWWQADLERMVALSQTRLQFPNEGNYRYKIEASNDGIHWKMAVDETATTVVKKERTAATVPGVIGRFVRITYTGLPAGKPAALSEAEFSGRLSSKN